MQQAKKRRRLAVRSAAAASTALLLQACGTVDPQPADGATGVPATRYAPSHSTAAELGASQYDVVGVASWYGRPYHGRRTASGQIYNMNQLTAAHPTLPFGTRVAVTNLANGRTVVVTINDRGPFKPDRIIDLSHKAAGQLGFLNPGLTQVRVVASTQG